MKLLGKFVLLFLIYNFQPSKIVEAGKDWWKHSIIYEVYVPSFKDSNGDGIGDLQGLRSMLDYFVDLGVDTLWLTPFFKSPLRDMGYDVSDYKEIEPIFGTMADFDQLMEEMKRKDLKLIFDLVINHSSDEHPWFNKSINRIEPYTDYYVWKNPKGFDQKGQPIPPNNWVALFGSPMWTWNEKRQQFYLHQFVENMPDFNPRNAFIKQEMQDIVTFWFDKGAAGARLDAIIYLVEDILLRDEPLIDPVNPPKVLTYSDYRHIYTTDLRETYEFVNQLKEFIDKSYSLNDEKILVAEAYTDDNHTMMYYGSEDYKVVNFPFNFRLVEITNFLRPKEMDSLIKNWLTKMPPHGVANWVSENHDRPRISSRLDVASGDIMLILTMTLPGVACVYYGQEIGMTDNHVFPFRSPDTADDYLDRARLPMQWDDSISAGFSSYVKTWLPVNSDYWRVNVNIEKNQKNSRLNLFKTLAKVRRTKALKYGNFVSYILSSWTYAYVRQFEDEGAIIVVMNLGSEIEVINLYHCIPNLPEFVKVIVSSSNGGYRRGNHIPTAEVRYNDSREIKRRVREYRV